MYIIYTPTKVSGLVLKEIKSCLNLVLYCLLPQIKPNNKGLHKIFLDIYIGETYSKINIKIYLCIK